MGKSHRHIVVEPRASPPDEFMPPEPVRINSMLMALFTRMTNVFPSSRLLNPYGLSVPNLLRVVGLSTPGLLRISGLAVPGLLRPAEPSIPDLQVSPLSTSGQNSPVSLDQKIIAFCPMHAGKDLVYLNRGAASEVWLVNKGQLENPPVYVSKILRVTPTNFDHWTNTSMGGESSSQSLTWTNFVKIYEDKVSEWVSLDHRNVIHVYNNPEDLNLRVEYCAHGCIREYLKSPSSKPIDKGQIAVDVLAGLAYLHSRSPPVIHGCLNAGKIFVDEHGKIKIGEFGLAALCYPIAPFVPAIMLTGCTRWMSPELLDMDPDTEETISPTIASDIWAFGCTIFEVVAGQLPYRAHTHDVSIQLAIMSGEKPDIRNTGFEKQYGGEACSIVETCWSSNPFERPRTGQILERLLVALEEMLVRRDANTSVEAGPSSRTPTRSHQNLPGIGVLTAREQLLGEDHYDTLEYMAELATKCREQDKLADAKSLGIKTLAARKRVLGGDHPDTLQSMADLALTYIKSAGDG